MGDAAAAVKNIEDKKGGAQQETPKLGILGSVNEALTRGLKKAPVPMSIAGVIGANILDDKVVRPGGKKVVDGVKKGVTFVFKGGKQAVADEVVSEGARQAVNAGAAGVKLYARALPKVVVEDTAKSVVKETGKNLVGGGGGFVIKALGDIFKALAG